MPGYQIRAACITVWPDKACMYDMDELPQQLIYCYFGGEETAPETGSKHKHVYAYAANRGMTLKAWKKLFGPQAHIEERRGTTTQAIDYCKKECEGKEFGERPMDNGKRKTAEILHEKLLAGAHPDDIGIDNPELFATCARYDKYATKVYNRLQRRKHVEQPFKPRQVYILQGKSDAGKTRSIYDEHGFDKCWVADTPTKLCGQWFDGYEGQSVAVFNDCGPGAILSVTQFLNLCDGYPVSVPVKGGFASWHPDYVYFTTNIDWRWWWPDISQEHLAAVKRRITEIRLFKEGGVVEFL